MVYLDSQIFKDDKLEISTGSLDRVTGVLVGDAITYVFKGDTARAERDRWRVPLFSEMRASTTVMGDHA
jgi:hypothetical protein